MKKTKYKQGRFRPNHPEKYKGDVNNIWYRSSWELKCMLKYDDNPHVLEWSNEEIIIPYRDPINGGWRRYFPDFWIKTKDGEMIVEIKPLKETLPPVKGKKRAKTLLNEHITYVMNQSKWAAAASFVQKNNMKFVILTEKDLFK